MSRDERIDRNATICGFSGLFLLWIWPLTNVITINQEHLVRADILQIILWVIGAFIALCLGFWFVLRDTKRVVTALALAVLFWLLGAQLLSSFSSGFDLIQFALGIGILAILVAAYFVLKRFPKQASVAMLIYGVLLVGIQFPGVSKVIASSSSDLQLEGLETTAPPSNEVSRPHIIYIVPDRYAGNAVLESHYEFSNHVFTDRLRDMGFHVWDNQFSNYPKTFMSLASTLNGNYLTEVTDEAREKSASFGYLNSLIQDNAALKALQARGYEYTHIGDWWGPTERNARADRNFEDARLPFRQLLRAYLEATPLNALLLHAAAKHTPCEVFEQKTRFIQETVQSEAPQFVFWHTLITHDPYIYAEDGSCRDTKADRYFANDYDARNTAYIQHVNRFNAAILQMIKDVRAETERDVIFVIQADEGPYPKALVDSVYAHGAPPYNYINADPTEIRRKHSVFNAIHLPSGDYADLESLASPVNNFRLILRELDGVQIPLLPDAFYSFELEENPYSLVEISDQLLD